MNPNVINIFSNDDLIKSIEIDHDVKNDNTNSFDELLHKVDSEKVFSEDKPINTSHEKTEVENKTSNSSNKNELNEKQDFFKTIGTSVKIFTSDGTRTHNPRLRRPMPYPLGYRGLQCIFFCSNYVYTNNLNALVEAYKLKQRQTLI